MTYYTITEKQDLNSTRAGEEIEAESLEQAKRMAEAMQFFQRTVMTIEECGVLLSWSDSDSGEWHDEEDVASWDYSEN